MQLPGQEAYSMMDARQNAHRDDAWYKDFEEAQLRLGLEGAAEYANARERQRVMAGGSVPVGMSPQQGTATTQRGIADVLQQRLRGGR